jgi:hypothetical protein
MMTRMAHESGPTDAERRAIQNAVDAGDLRRAKALLAGVRRRMDAMSRRKDKQDRKATSRRKSGAAAIKRTRRPVRKTGTKATQPAKKKAKRMPPLTSKACGRCGAQFRPDSGRRRLCSLCRPRTSNSVRTVSGGLPSLRKRR